MAYGSIVCIIFLAPVGELRIDTTVSNSYIGISGSLFSFFHFSGEVAGAEIRIIKQDLSTPTPLEGFVPVHLCRETKPIKLNATETPPLGYFSTHPYL